MLERERMNMKRFLCLILCFLLSACSSPSEVVYDTAEEAYLAGYHAFEKTDYEAAAEIFDQVEQNFPFSEWADKAQVMMAYSQYKRNEYNEALLTLDRFIQLHPGNKNTPYAIYLKGLCYFEQMSDTTREQEMAANAEHSFQELVARYPSSIYYNDAKAKLVMIQNHLSGKEMEIGRYYQKREDFTAAMNRFQAVLINYPDSNQVPEAYYRLAACYQALGMVKQAQAVSKKMSERFENSLWTKRAQKIMGQ